MRELHAIAEVPGRGAPPGIAAIYAEMRAALEGFSSVTICKMIPIGLLLALAFGGGRARGV